MLVYWYSEKNFFSTSLFSYIILGIHHNRTSHTIHFLVRAVSFSWFWDNKQEWGSTVIMESQCSRDSTPCFFLAQKIAPIIACPQDWIGLVCAMHLPNSKLNCGWLDFYRTQSNLCKKLPKPVQWMGYVGWPY